MAFYDKFPYTNFHELNLDWLTQEVSKVRDNRDASDASAAAALASEKAAKASETAALASQQAAKASETAALASQQAAAGSEAASADYLAQIGTHTAGAAADWLKENLTTTTPPVDASLTVSGAAADAKKTGDAVFNLNHTLSDYVLLNDNRFTFSENLFNSSSALLNYYIDKNTGSLVSYDNWFTTPHIQVDDSKNYNFVIMERGHPWKQPAGVYYAFYDKNYGFTHGGISAADTAIATEPGDKFFRGSYYSSAIDATMFGTDTDMSAYIGTSKEKAPYYTAPKYEKDPYMGLISVFANIDSPYYSLRVSGNRISVSRDGLIEGAFIKFGSITTIGEEGFKTKSWDDFKTDVQGDPYISFVRAYDGTPDTLRLLPEYGIVYNYKTNTYHVRNKVYITKLTKHDAILFYNDVNSVPNGVLFDAWANNHKTGISKYIRTIEEKETTLLNYADKFVFAFATDCHWYFDDSAYHNYTNEMIEELHKTIGFDAYINGGDSIYYGTKFKLNGVASMSEAFKPEHDNLVYCIGNHDYNGVSGQTQNNAWMFDSEGIESLCLRKMKNINRPNGARYYYRDFNDKKMRVIVLDTSDIDLTFKNDGTLTSADPLIKFIIRQNQIDWFCNALNCPSADWGVIVVMHVGLYVDEDGFPHNNPVINKQALISVLNAYVNKTTYSYSTSTESPVSGNGDFANANGHLIGVWSGHAHADGYCNKDGFNAIQTECGYPDSESRAVGTIDEICVDCVCVDMTAKKVTLKRFGSGSDREYTFI